MTSLADASLRNDPSPHTPDAALASGVGGGLAELANGPTALSATDLGPAAVTVSALDVSMGGQAILRNVSFQVFSGELVAILGPSGCGKSTLLRVLAGLAPTVARLSERSTVRVPLREDGRRDVAWMPQQDALLPWRRTRSNVCLGARLAGQSRTQAGERADALLERFGLIEAASKWPHELSGGMRQRAAIARTVLANRQVLMLDEPFGALDALTRRTMNSWLDDQRRTGGLGAAHTVLLVTHDVEEALTLADRILVLGSDPAGIVAVADVEELGVETARRVVLAALGADVLD